MIPAHDLDLPQVIVMLPLHKVHLLQQLGLMELELSHHPLKEAEEEGEEEEREKRGERGGGGGGGGEEEE